VRALGRGESDRGVAIDVPETDRERRHGSGQFVGDIFFVALPNKRRLPRTRSALPIDRRFAVRLIPEQGCHPILFVAVEKRLLRPKPRS
jgi:hypothetical protein